MDVEPYFKVHNLVSVYPKNMKLIVQMTAINVIFHVVVPDYQLSLEFALVPHVILQWPIVPYLQ